MTSEALQTLQDAWTSERVTALRERLRMKQGEMAPSIGYSHASRVSELEAGTRKVTGQVALLLEYLDRYGPLDLAAEADG